MTKWATALAAVLSFTCLSAQTAEYRLIDLGPGYGRTRINQNGDVTGYKEVAGERVSFRYIYSEGRLKVLAEDPQMMAMNLNDKGVIAGSRFGPGYTSEAVVWHRKQTSTLPSLGGDYTTAEAINNAGQITGVSTTAEGKHHAYLYSNGVMTDLGMLADWTTSSTHGRAINRFGHVAGEAFLGCCTHAFLYRDGVMHDLSKGGPATYYHYKVHAMNDKGVVVGSADTASPEGALVMRVGKRPLILAGLTEAFGINNAGHIVGLFRNFDTTARICVNEICELLKPKVGSSGDGWKLYEAHDINDQGLISGYGSWNNRGRHFLLVPL